MMIAVWAIAIGSLIIIVYLLLAAPSVDPIETRLHEASATHPAFPGNPGLGVVPPTVNNEVIRRAREEAKKVTLRDRLMQAGWYKERSGTFYSLLRIGLALLPVGLGICAGLTGATTLPIGLVLGGLLSGVGTIAPSFLLDHLKANRQKRIQRALPDALDVIVVCLEGGLSLSSSFSRVARELADAHPLLALELKIVEREVQMGRSTGEAMRNFANRFDLEELRSMAAVIIQAEKFGTSVVKALTVYAETMRMKRQQRAEEMAQKATVKIIFPTLLCIFPAIFVVILGPAGIQIYETLGKMAK